MSKILICKNDEYIMISQNGKNLIIEKNNKLFNQLKGLNKEEIIKWYNNR